MAGMYDNLGDFLNEALEKGEIPVSKKRSESTIGTENTNNYSRQESNSYNTKKTEVDSLPVNLIEAFNTLHSNPDNSFNDVKKNYHQLLLLYHPDTKSEENMSINSDTVTQFRQIQTQKLIEAFEEVKKYYEK